VDALDLLPSEREAELDVGGRLGVVRQLGGLVGTHAQAFLPEAELAVEAHALRQPVLEPLLALARVHEELELRLLELARTEREVPRVDLVAEGLADLGDAERHLLARGLAHALPVGEDRLAGLGAQPRDAGRVLGGADEGLQHQVEGAGRGQIVRSVLARIAGVDAVELVGAEAALAGAAVDELVAEVLDVARSLPRARVADDRAVQALDVVALAHDAAPPERLQVVLELDAERPVVPEPVDPAVDLARLEHEPTPGAERDDVLHADVGTGARCGIGGHGERSVPVSPRECKPAAGCAQRAGLRAASAGARGASASRAVGAARSEPEASGVPGHRGDDLTAC
jgi:hypothetical protein